MEGQKEEEGIDERRRKIVGAKGEEEKEGKKENKKEREEDGGRIEWRDELPATRIAMLERKKSLDAFHCPGLREREKESLSEVFQPFHLPSLYHSSIPPMHVDFIVMR